MKMINATNISSKNRERKYKLFLETIKPSEKDTVLDVGFNNMEYSPVDNYLEKNYPYLSNITALGIGSGDLFKKNYPDIKTIIYDGITFPFEDKTFDIVWSNAVLEHVGNESCQIRFLKELCRTGKKVYFTTPNRWFPFELHSRLPLLHWLPKKIFDKLLYKTSHRWVTGDYMYLLSKKKLKTLLKKAEITDYHIYKNRFCGFTMDFSVIISPANN
jgi:SAM-dependent methyltransferase